MRWIDLAGFVLIVASAVVAVQWFPGGEDKTFEQVVFCVALAVTALVGIAIVLGGFFDVKSLIRGRTQTIAGYWILAAGFALVVASVVVAILWFPAATENKESDTLEQVVFSGAVAVMALLGIAIVLGVFFDVKSLVAGGSSSYGGPGVSPIFSLVAAGVFLGVLVAATRALPHTPEVQIGMTVVLGVSAVLVLLFVIATGYSKLGLANKYQPLGLPEGSVRAILALFLIIVFVMMGIFVFWTIGRDEASRGTFHGLTLEQAQALGPLAALQPETATPSPTPAPGETPGATPAPGVVTPTPVALFGGGTHNPLSAEAKQLGIQLATILGTLATAVSAFYFATSAVASAVAGTVTRAGGEEEAPELVMVKQLQKEIDEKKKKLFGLTDQAEINTLKEEIKALETRIAGFKEEFAKRVVKEQLEKLGPDTTGASEPPKATEPPATPGTTT